MLLCVTVKLKCRPDLLTAQHYYLLHYSVRLLKPFSLAYSLAFRFRSSLYGAVKWNEKRPLRISTSMRPVFGSPSSGRHHAPAPSLPA